jgi:hypothetical protein
MEANLLKIYGYLIFFSILLGIYVACFFLIFDFINSLCYVARVSFELLKLNRKMMEVNGMIF